MKQLSLASVAKIINDAAQIKRDINQSAAEV